jgi:hypothetical protein
MPIAKNTFRANPRKVTINGSNKSSFAIGGDDGRPYSTVVKRPQVLNSFVIILFNLLINKAKANRERVTHIINAKDIEEKHVEFVCLVCTVQKKYIRVLI